LKEYTMAKRKVEAEKVVRILDLAENFVRRQEALADELIRNCQIPNLLVLSICTKSVGTWRRSG